MVSRFYDFQTASRYSEVFARAVAFVLERETEFNHNGTGRCERDPNDPGGTNMYGIGVASHPGVDVAHPVTDQAKAIYHATG